MSIREAEALKRRSMSFLEEAERLYGEAKYDLAAFMAEQACQLYLKYKLLIHVGTYPRTHSVKHLLSELAKLKPELSEMLDRYALELGALEDAYIASRYLPREYSRGEVERLLVAVRSVIGAVGDG